MDISSSRGIQVGDGNSQDNRTVQIFNGPVLIGGPQSTSEDLVRLPPSVQDALKRLLEAGREEAFPLLATLLSDAGNAITALTSWFTDPPSWAVSGGSVIWLAGAEYAAAHREHDLASRLFEKTADLDAERGRWLLRAAVARAQTSDVGRTLSLVERAEGLGTVPALVRLLRAAVQGDQDTISAIDFADVVDEAWACQILASAAAASAGPRAAILLARRGLDRHPEAAGLRLELARYLVAAHHEAPAQVSASVLFEAVEQAIAVRDARRAWGGHAAEALIVACAAGLHAGDWNRVIRLGSPAPDGEATAIEAEDPEVACLVGRAALHTDDVQLAVLVAARLPDTFERHLLTGHVAQLRGDEHEAAEAYRRALGQAVDVSQRFDAAFALAALGKVDHDFCAAENFGARNTALLDAAIAMCRKDFPGAMAVLRPYRRQVPVVTQLLAECHDRCGDSEGAADVLLEDGGAFQDAGMLLQAAVLRYRNGDRVEADAAACLVLDLPPAAAMTVKDAYLLRLQVAQDDESWPRIVAVARAATIALPEDVDLRWHLVRGLAAQHDYEGAWQEFCRPPRLLVGLPWHAHAVMAAAERAMSGPQLSRFLLDVVDRFPDDADVLAHALGIVMSARDTGDVDEAVSGRWRDLFARFSHDHSDHPALRTLHLPEDPGKWTDALRPFLEPGAAALGQLLRQVLDGVLPYGILSAQLGRPYAAALVHRAAGCLPFESPDPAVQSLELRAAREALDGEVVIDASVLAVNAHVRGLWPLIVGLFRTVTTTAAAHIDVHSAVDLLNRPGDSVIGWDTREDRPTVTDIDPAVTTLLRDHASWITGVTDQLNVVDHAITDERLTDPNGPGDRDPRFTPWLSPLDLAAARGLPLFSDDVVLRQLARSVGVPTFGTAALLRHLENAHIVTADRARTWRLGLRAACCVDLPFVAAELIELAESEQWQPRGAAYALTRPAAWSDPYAVLRLLHHVLDHLADDVPAAAGWLHAAVTGFTTGRPPTIAQGVTNALTGLFTARLGATPEAFSVLVTAARSAYRDACGRELLDVFVPDLLDRLTTKHGPQTAARALLHMASAMPDPDRREVTGRILRPSATSP